MSPQCTEKVHRGLTLAGPVTDNIFLLIAAVKP
jgi:hypothetical protein